MRRQFDQWPIDGLKELAVVTRDVSAYRRTRAHQAPVDNLAMHDVITGAQGSTKGPLPGAARGARCRLPAAARHHAYGTGRCADWPDVERQRVG
ncbi:hypothetical protein GCM10009541_56010 [Micromonospora gifhornensis]